MFLTLWKKECVQVGKSLVYWLYVAALVFFFMSQLGNLNIIQEPEKGQENYYAYGFQHEVSEEEVMKYGIGSLAWDYYYDHYTTYPVGYAKDVQLSEKEKEEISDILYELCGMDGAAVEADIERYFSEHDIQTEAYAVQPREGLAYEEFLKQMERVADILGPGSAYTEEMLRANVRIPLDYEGAVKAYENLTEKEGLTGGYARLFCDYMGVVLGILPVFATAARVLRDRRAGVQGILYARKVSSPVLVGTRYLALVTMHLVPVLLLSLVPLADCMQAAGDISLDYFAWLKYDLGWLLPMIMVVTAAGMLLTELTETALAVLVQAVWWFVSVMGGGAAMEGGSYGWNLIPRHNTEMNYQAFRDGFGQLAANRAVYALAAILMAIVTVWVYEQKRKGHLVRRGKLSGNCKNRDKAPSLETYSA